MLTHREAPIPPCGAQTTTKRLSVCGMPWTADLDGDGPPCDVCWPGRAHPMAGVWRLCRRFDASYNAGLAR